jgi:hypothetical protein
MPLTCYRVRRHRQTPQGVVHTKDERATYTCVVRPDDERARLAGVSSKPLMDATATKPPHRTETPTAAPKFGMHISQQWPFAR